MLRNKNKLLVTGSLLMGLFCGSALVQSCDGGGGSEEEQDIKTIQRQKLTQTSWGIKSVTLDREDKTSDYASLTLTLSPSEASGASALSYTINNLPDPSPWPNANGVFVFDETNPVSKLFRDPSQNDNGLEVTYTVEDDQLQMDFVYNIDPPSTARVLSAEGIEGGWSFSFEAR